MRRRLHAIMCTTIGEGTMYKILNDRNIRNDGRICNCRAYIIIITPGGGNPTSRVSILPYCTVHVNQVYCSD